VRGVAFMNAPKWMVTKRGWTYNGLMHGRYCRRPPTHSTTIVWLNLPPPAGADWLPTTSFYYYSLA
jgi:hypothetical protein